MEPNTTPVSSGGVCKGTGYQPPNWRATEVQLGIGGSGFVGTDHLTNSSRSFSSITRNRCHLLVDRGDFHHFQVLYEPDTPKH